MYPTDEVETIPHFPCVLRSSCAVQDIFTLIPENHDLVQTCLVECADGFTKGRDLGKIAKMRCICLPCMLHPVYVLGTKVLEAMP